MFGSDTSSRPRGTRVLGTRVLGTLAVLATTLTLSLAGCAKDLTGSPHVTAPARATTTSAAPRVPQPSDVLPQPTASDTTPPAQTPEPSVTPTSPAKPEAILKRGDSGDKVRELQHRLLQIDWYAGKIGPSYDQQTEAAVQGFQGKRGLTVTGEVDQVTWDKLAAMTELPTRDQMYNVLRPGPAIMKSGSTGDKVRDLQARLKQIGWFDPLVDGDYGPATVAAVKAFQAKREIPVTGEVDQRTLDRLAGMTSRPTVEELTNKPPKVVAPAALDQRCMTGRVLCINKTSNKLYWVVDGTVKQRLDVRFGSELTPTREGVFTLYWKSRNHHSTIYDTPMPYAMFFSGGQAVHYSADFAARGYNGASHGCVNVRDKAGIIWLFDQTREGDKVVVYW